VRRGLRLSRLGNFLPDRLLRIARRQGAGAPSRTSGPATIKV